MSQLEGMESKLTGELEAVRVKIENLRRQRAALESRIAAIRSLPNEILAHIFELGVTDELEPEPEPEEEVAEEDEGQATKVEFRLLVSQVCRMFREVAICTPSLWTQIHILYLVPGRINFAQICVERSGGARLDILVDCDDLYTENTPELILRLMSILGPHTARFKRFTARLRGFQYLHLVMRELNRPAPELETLELSDINYDKAFNEVETFEPLDLCGPLTLFGGVTPKLSRIYLDGAHVAWAKCDFTGLVELRLEHHTQDVRPSYDEFKAIIDASPDLHSLDLCGSAPVLSEDATEASLYPPLRLDRLETLHISSIPSEYITILISLLHAPNLQSLSLTDLDTNDYSAFFRRIVGPPVLFPALTALKLAAVEAEEVAFEALLGALPSVTYLALYFHRLEPTLLTCLELQGPKRQVLCPKLDLLKCVGAAAHDIKQVLEKRQQAGFPISRLQIDQETENVGTKSCMEWIRENATVEIIEPSEHDSDEEPYDSGSEWTDEDELGGIPYFSMEGFSDESSDGSVMDVDGSEWG